MKTIFGTKCVSKRTSRITAAVCFLFVSSFINTLYKNILFQGSMHCSHLVKEYYFVSNENCPVEHCCGCLIVIISLELCHMIRL